MNGAMITNSSTTANEAQPPRVKGAARIDPGMTRNTVKRMQFPHHAQRCLKKRPTAYANHAKHAKTNKHNVRSRFPECNSTTSATPHIRDNNTFDTLDRF